MSLYHGSGFEEPPSPNGTVSFLCARTLAMSQIDRFFDLCDLKLVLIALPSLVIE